jgi:ferredoxin
MPLLKKPVRLVISSLVLILFIFIYLDCWTILSVRLSKYILDIQFIPSLLRTLVSHTFLFGGFIIIILISLLFGRLYCSFLCPLGCMQDIIIFIKRKFTKSRKRRFHSLPSLKGLRYGILVISLVSVFSGSIMLLIWLDPYSISGRIMTHIIRPLFTLSFNTMVGGLNYLNEYSVLPVDWTFRFHLAFWSIITWFLLIIVLSAVYGRLYCNSLCPVGTFLGLISRISLYQLSIDETSCWSCGRCARVCKAGCIDLETAEIDFSRCVGCQNCIQSCDQSSIQYRNMLKSRRQGHLEIDGARRSWLGKSFSMALLLQLSIIKAPSGKNENDKSKDELPRRKAITPPGSLGRIHFTEHCTACHLCINHCPTQVLQPSGLKISIEGMFQPVMDFSVKYCLYECNICSLVCPTAAIMPVSIGEKKKIQLGRSRLIEHLCVVVTKGTLCGACSEHCPTKACNMVPYKNNLSIPEINNTICVGCGACEHACPTQPKSIVVDENIIHLTAALPEKKILKPLINKGKEVPEEFPF